MQGIYQHPRYPHIPMHVRIKIGRVLCLTKVYRYRVIRFITNQHLFYLTEVTLLSAQIRVYRLRLFSIKAKIDFVLFFCLSYKGIPSDENWYYLNWCLWREIKTEIKTLFVSRQDGRSQKAALSTKRFLRFLKFWVTKAAFTLVRFTQKAGSFH